MQILIVLVIFAFPKLQAKSFNLSSMPKGAEITLPYPATTSMTLNDRVTVSATDNPQSIKIMSRLLNRKKPAKNIDIAIYDRNSERVRYITIKPDVPYIYSFKGLSSIVIVPKTPTERRRWHVLQIESDKSLKIAR